MSHGRWLGPFAAVLTCIGCSSSGGDSSFDDLVNSDIGTFGEPTEHECETNAQADCASASDFQGCYAERLASCATDYYLRGYSPEELPDCDPSKPLVPISANLELSLFRGEGIRDGEVVPNAQGLQRYYEPHDLWMTTAAVARVVDMKYALTGSEADFLDALEQAGVDPTVDEDAASEVIGRVMFAPTREFLETYAVPAWAGVNVVVIGQVFSPELVEVMGIDGTVVGLGLSAALLERTELEGDTSTSLNTMLDLSGDFTPSLFVGSDDIEALSGSFDLVIAHELGHCLGLPHVLDSDNLMEQGGSQSCRRWLSESQVAEMGPFSDAAATNTALAESSEKRAAAAKRFVGVIEADQGLAELLALPRKVARKLAGKQD